MKASIARAAFSCFARFCREEIMHPTLVRAFAWAIAAVASVTAVHAQQGGPAAKTFDRGRYEYEAHCAVCHGLSGKGDGPFAGQLQTAAVVPDLTELSKKNSGVFPFMRVYEMIDGERSLTWHGTRQMPIWGPRYRSEAGESAYDDFRADPDVFVRARILALSEYVYRLQGK
jgi:mono/diheme cytochrome c family protein